ncbi:NAD(P)H-dependent oxidoreductase [Octadecabacter sp. 1_MG-2023]|uniref:NAD(P)H-dependent oxidoreductase n=1 Tax=unclassified Octadecabacter TaxID=196158 RepID=UPI001C09CE39|nr:MULTISPECIES: NAD(P)H-dependent oxidoreductase [unclassified Octadecabacter]MBU2994557.1 NAD(P)H-dependent oxidoreductase [Octadecabacter sp. B2R22]MDO6734150.1 NAD(P)H-dependent oxidoreductase [Octadecabacter sp. 1_MG-2023]
MLDALPSTLSDALQWRYAVKKFDPSKPVSDDKIDAILDAIQLAPTSSGSQPFKVFVIRNDDVRAKLRAVSFDQPQVTDSTALLVFAAWENYSEQRIDDVVDVHAEQRPGTREMLEGYYGNLKAMYLPRDPYVNFEHAARQSYIALGFAMYTAAQMQIDTTPMEGFDAAAVDEILGLSDQGLKAVSFLAVGTRADEGDWLAPMAKVRKSKDVLFERID